MKIQRYNIKVGPKRDIKILRPTPTPDDPWGALASLKGTPWQPLIPEIPGDAHSHALHGYPGPFLAVLGRPPYAQALKLPESHRVCSMHNQGCLGAGEKCRPGPGMPDCYEPPGLDDPEARTAATLVAEAWAEGRYVVVIVGDEFSL